MNSCTQIGLLTLNSAATLKGGYIKTKNISYSPSDSLRLDIYQPKKSLSLPPTVIFLHGGSWQSGNKSQYKFMAQTLTAAGYIAVIPDYRLYPQVKFPAFVADAAASVRWVHDHISEYGGDPQKIFVMGHSAGAHIGALLALDAHYLRDVGGNGHWIRGFVGLAGPYNFLPFTSEVDKIIFGPPEKFLHSQPIHFVDGLAAPFLLLHGEKDTTVYPRNSRTLAQKIRDKGGRVQEIYYEKMDHVRILINFASLLQKEELVEMVKEFIGRFTYSVAKVLSPISDTINEPIKNRRQKSRLSPK